MTENIGKNLIKFLEIARITLNETDIGFIEYIAEELDLSVNEVINLGTELEAYLDE